MSREFAPRFVTGLSGSRWKRLDTDNGLYYDYELLEDEVDIINSSDRYNLRFIDRGLIPGYLGGINLGNDVDYISLVAYGCAYIVKKDKSLWKISVNEPNNPHELVINSVEFVIPIDILNSTYVIILDGNDQSWYLVHSSRLGSYEANRKSIRSRLRRDEVNQFRDGLIITNRYVMTIINSSNPRFIKTPLPHPQSDSLIYMNDNHTILMNGDSFYLLSVWGNQIELLYPVNTALELITSIIGMTYIYVSNQNQDYLLARDGTTYVLDDKLGLIKTMIPPHIYGFTNNKSARTSVNQS